MSSVLDEVEAVEPAPDFLSVIAGARSAFLLSLDVGTSGVRAALFDDLGNEISGAQISSQRSVQAFSDLGILDADAIVAQVIETIDDLLTTVVDNVHRIRVVAISCFWHSLLGIDSNERPTTPVLSWADTRAAPSASFIRSRFDENEFHQRTGCRFHASYWPAKLHWIKQEQPAIFQNTKQWLGFSEYLCQTLFGSTLISVSMASATGLLDQRTCEWDTNCLQALEITQDVLPEIASGDEHPQLRPEFAQRWPVLSEARLSVVVGDGAANNIGGGCSTRDRFALMVGTSGAMRVAFDGDPLNHLPPSLWSYRVDRSKVVVGGALSDGGGLYRWLTDLMCIGDDAADLESRLAAFEPDSHGLTVLPFWSGERSTGWSENARGAILGLTQQTKPIQIVRAALEAIAYRFALIAQALESLAGDATIVATGNALRSSRAWSQIIADVLDKRVLLTNVREASTRGAALLALEAVGKIETLQQDSLRVEEVFEPDATRHMQYRKGLFRQQEIYERLFKSTSIP
jgi:gluconokinase